MQRFRRGIVVGTVVVLGLAAAVLALGGRALVGAVPAVERLYTRWVPPTAPVLVTDDDTDDDDAVLNDAERTAIATLGGSIRGRLVWSSNRGGNHDLYLADLTTGSVARITDDPAVDYFSRFSPDGTQIAFLRSRRPWVSFREEGAWDLYLMQADGSEPRRLAEHAYHPTWKPDGSGFVFLRDNTIMSFDLATGEERVIQEGSAPPLEGRIGDPELGADGRLVVTVRRSGGQRVGVLDLARGVFEPVSRVGACHITWAPGGQRVVWMQGEGNGGNRVMQAQPGADDRAVLIDLPGDRSHEYFPRVTNDGEWLIWAATDTGHEHDRADYDLFAWRLGTDWATALRLTHTPANDQWPDLFIDP